MRPTHARHLTSVSSLTNRNKNDIRGACKIALPIKALAYKPEDLNSVSRIHTMEGENQSPQVVLWLLHVLYTSAHPRARSYTINEYIINVFKKDIYGQAWWHASIVVTTQ